MIELLGVAELLTLRLQARIASAVNTKNRRGCHFFITFVGLETEC
jgi:hypothetical protein